jgi:hypothetical protein
MPLGSYWLGVGGRDMLCEQKVHDLEDCVHGSAVMSLEV